MQNNARNTAQQIYAQFKANHVYVEKYKTNEGGRWVTVNKGGEDGKGNPIFIKGDGTVRKPDPSRRSTTAPPRKRNRSDKDQIRMDGSRNSVAGKNQGRLSQKPALKKPRPQAADMSFDFGSDYEQKKQEAKNKYWKPKSTLDKDIAETIGSDNREDIQGVKQALDTVYEMEKARVKGHNDRYRMVANLIGAAKARGFTAAGKNLDLGESRTGEMATDAVMRNLPAGFLTAGMEERELSELLSEGTIKPKLKSQLVGEAAEYWERSKTNNIPAPKKIDREPVGAFGDDAFTLGKSATVDRYSFKESEHPRDSDGKFTVTQSRPERRNDSFDDQFDFKTDGGRMGVAKSKWAPTDWSVTDTLTDEDKRGKGIASALIQKAKDNLDGTIGAQTSSDASTRLFWKHGFRLPGGGSLEDAYAKRAEDSSVNLIYDPSQQEAPQQPKKDAQNSLFGKGKFIPKKYDDKDAAELGVDISHQKESQSSLFETGKEPRPMKPKKNTAGNLPGQQSLFAAYYENLIERAKYGLDNSDWTIDRFARQLGLFGDASKDTGATKSQPRLFDTFTGQATTKTTTKRAASRESKPSTPQKKKDGGWITIHGTHVFIDKKGQISKGPDHFVGKKPSEINKDTKYKLPAKKEEPKKPEPAKQKKPQHIDQFNQEGQDVLYTGDPKRGEQKAKVFGDPNNKTWTGSTSESGEKVMAIKVQTPDGRVHMASGGQLKPAEKDASPINRDVESLVKHNMKEPGGGATLRGVTPEQVNAVLGGKGQIIDAGKEFKDNVADLEKKFAIKPGVLEDAIKNHREKGSQGFENSEFRSFTREAWKPVIDKINNTNENVIVHGLDDVAKDFPIDPHEIKGLKFRDYHDGEGKFLISDTIEPPMGKTAIGEAKAEKEEPKTEKSDVDPDHAAALNKAKAFSEYGQDYDRNVADPLARYNSAKRRGHSKQMLDHLHKELQARLDGKAERETAKAKRDEAKAEPKSIESRFNDAKAKAKKEGPNDGDKNEKGLVFRNGRWRREGESKNVKVSELRDKMSQLRNAANDVKAAANDKEKSRAQGHVDKIAGELAGMTSRTANDRDRERMHSILDEVGHKGPRLGFAKRKWEKTVGEARDEDTAIGKMERSDGTGQKGLIDRSNKLRRDQEEAISSAFERGENVPDKALESAGIKKAEKGKAEWDSEKGTSMSLDKGFNFWKDGIPYSHTTSAKKSNIELAAEHLKEKGGDKVSLQFNHDGDGKLAKSYMNRVEKLADAAGYEVGEEKMKTVKGYDHSNSSVVTLTKQGGEKSPTPEFDDVRDGLKHLSEANSRGDKEAAKAINARIDELKGGSKIEPKKPIEKTFDEAKARAKERAKASDGPKDGDKDANGLVFRNGRWRREDSEAKEAKPKKLTKDEKLNRRMFGPRDDDPKAGGNPFKSGTLASNAKDGELVTPDEIKKAISDKTGVFDKDSGYRLHATDEQTKEQSDILRGSKFKHEAIASQFKSKSEDIKSQIASKLAEEQTVRAIGKRLQKTDIDASKKYFDKAKVLSSDADKLVAKHQEEEAFFKASENRNGAKKQTKSLEELKADRKKVSDDHIWNNAMSKGSTRPSPPDTSELNKKIKDAEASEGKADWQRDPESVKNVKGMPIEKHKELVEKALAEGRDVPKSVLEKHGLDSKKPLPVSPQDVNAIHELRSDDKRPTRKTRDAAIDAVNAVRSKIGREARELLGKGGIGMNQARMQPDQAATHFVHQINKAKTNEEAKKFATTALEQMSGSWDRLHEELGKSAKGEKKDDFGSKPVSKKLFQDLVNKAHGHEDNASTQAARRLLKRRGVDWKDREPNDGPKKEPKQAAESSKDHRGNDWAPGVTANIIPRQTAYNAHAGTSHSPERRAETRQKEFAAAMNSDYQELKAAAKGDENKLKTLDGQWPRYLDRAKSNYIAALNADSRTMSPMITGPARFPVSSNNKKMDTASKRWDEFHEGLKKGMKSIKKQMSPEDAPIKIGDKGVGSVLDNKIEAMQKHQDHMKEANAIIRRHVDFKKTSHYSGDVYFKDGKSADGLVKELQEKTGISETDAKKLARRDPYSNSVGYPKFQLTNNNANIRRTKDQVREQQRHEAEAAKVAEENDGDSLKSHSFDGGNVELDYDDNRLRIVHDQKPSKEVIQSLKSRGFRWSPKNGAWQRQLTRQAKYDAESLVGVNFDDVEKSSVLASGSRIERFYNDRLNQFKQNARITA